MNQTNANLPGGVNTDYMALLAEVEKVIFTKKDVKFSSLTDALSVAKWKDMINKDLSIYVVGGLYDYDATTDKPGVTSLPSTRKLINNRPIPSAELFLESNFSDFQEVVRSLKGGLYGVIYQLRDGSFKMRKNSVGEYLPFTASLTAITEGIPFKAGDSHKNYPVFVNHTNYREFEDATLVCPDWNANDLVTFMPVGLNVDVVSTVTAGAVSVSIRKRAGDGVTGLLVADFEILDTNNLVLPIVATVVDNGLGSYVLTLQKASTPVAIATGDYMTLRVKKMTSLVVSLISNRFTINA